MELHIPTKDGLFRNVVLGFKEPFDYLSNPLYLGAIVGRYANRIANGAFVLDNVKYQLSVNNGSNCLHGGTVGFDQQIWKVTSQSESHIVFALRSEEGNQGFPGQLDVRVKYMIDRDNQFLINYRVTTDAPTVVNLTNHAYFNLDGAGKGTIVDHILEMEADNITAINEKLIPTGEFMSVENTPFDFRKPMKIGARIDDDHLQLNYANGYDHNYVLNNSSGDLKQFAKITSSDDQVTMDVLTTEPGVQFYSGNSMDINDANGKIFNKREGFCLETQHFPNSPNQASFPSTVLRPGEVYESQTAYRFS